MCAFEPNGIVPSGPCEPDANLRAQIATWNLEQAQAGRRCDFGRNGCRFLTQLDEPRAIEAERSLGADSGARRSPPLRILHLIDHLGLGGAQTALAALLEAWPDQGDQISVVGLGRRSELAPRLRQAPAVVAVQTLAAGRWSWRPVGQVAQLLRHGDFDLIHAHLCKSNATALWLYPGYRTPLVVQVHADPRRDFLPVRLALRFWHARASAVVGVSERTTAACRDLGVPQGQLHTIYCPLPRRLAGVSSSGAAPTRKAPVVGFVGRLAGEKGLTYLLQALQKLATSHPELTAMLVGDGPLRDSLEREAARRGLGNSVTFAGYQADPTAWIRACELLVMPSLTEGLPLAVVEAMALGVPVVASNVGGIPEVVQHARTGLLVAPRDVAGLCQAISRLVESPDLRRDLAENARREIVPRFSAEGIIGQWQELYRSVISV